MSIITIFHFSFFIRALRTRKVIEYFVKTNSETRVRLACVRRTASVHSEPGSNSLKELKIFVGDALYRIPVRRSPKGVGGKLFNKS